MSCIGGKTAISAYWNRNARNFDRKGRPRWAPFFFCSAGLENLRKEYTFGCRSVRSARFPRGGDECPWPTGGRSSAVYANQRTGASVASRDGRPRLAGLTWERTPSGSRVTCRLVWHQQSAEVVAEHAEPARAAVDAVIRALEALMGRHPGVQLVDSREEVTAGGRVWVCVLEGPDRETLVGAATGRHEVEAVTKAVLAALNRRLPVWKPSEHTS